MKKDRLYLYWVVVLFIEMFWLYSFTNRPSSPADLTYAVTLIAVTLTLGVVRIKWFRGSDD